MKVVLNNKNKDILIVRKFASLNKRSLSYRNEGDGPLWRNYRWSNYFFKWTNPGHFLFIFVLFKHKFYRKNCMLQWDSNSDRWSRRRACWPLNHYHGLIFLYFRLLNKVLIRLTENKIFQDWIRTVDLLSPKQLLYQLSHNHCMIWSISLWYQHKPTFSERTINF